MSFSRKQKTFSPGACPESGCIQKKPNGKWGVISNKTGEFWDADYDTEEAARAGLAAYHANKHFSDFHDFPLFIIQEGSNYFIFRVDSEEDEKKLDKSVDKGQWKIVKRVFDGVFGKNKEEKAKEILDELKNGKKEKKWKLFSDIHSDEEFIKACHDAAKSILGDGYDQDTTEKTAQGILKDHKDEGYDTMIGMFTNALKGGKKSFSLLPVEDDPSILGREPKNKPNKDTEIEPSQFKSWKVGSAFGMNIEPWLVAESLNSPTDGIYAGILESDEIQLGDGEKILLNIKSNVGQPNDVLVYVKGQKVYIWKCEQIRSITKKYSSFDIQSNYSFDLMPTELKLDMEHLIGSWMLAASICHLYHICDENYAGHIALEQFYEDFPEKIDVLAEHYLADNDKAEFRICIVPKRCPIDYLTRLLKFTKDYVEANETSIPSSYQSQIDDITNFTQSILYKLKRLDSGRRLFSDASKKKAQTPAEMAHWTNQNKNMAKQGMSKNDNLVKSLLMEKDNYKGFWPLSKFIADLKHYGVNDQAYNKIPKDYYWLGNGDCLFDDGLIDETKFPDDKEFGKDKKKIIFESPKKIKRQMRDGSFREFATGPFIYEYNTSVGKIILVGEYGAGMRPDFFGPKEVVDKVVNQAYIDKLMK